MAALRSLFTPPIRSEIFRKSSKASPCCWEEISPPRGMKQQAFRRPRMPLEAFGNLGWAIGHPGNHGLPERLVPEPAFPIWTSPPA